MVNCNGEIPRYKTIKYNSNYVRTIDIHFLVVRSEGIGRECEGFIHDIVIEKMVMASLAMESSKMRISSTTRRIESTQNVDTCKNYAG